MNSEQAVAWLFIDLINRHLREVVDPFDATYDPDRCGPCKALRDYWLTTVGKMHAQDCLNHLSLEDRTWVWAPDGIIDWTEIERRTAGGQEVSPVIMVRQKVYDEMAEDQKLFIALQNAGVDNWEGWADVLAAYQEEN